jgi:hypothetical protein
MDKAGGLVLWSAALSSAVNLKRSAHAIVIAPNASHSERQGAEELQPFLEKISGTKLAIPTEARPEMILAGNGHTEAIVENQTPIPAASRNRNRRVPESSRST